MCGIAGVMTRDGAPPSAVSLRLLGDALAHRGPDGTGQYRAANTALVHRRLAIIDLATGDQPLSEPEGAVLIANAEIYNYLELRAELPEVRFATQSDCELPLVLYRRLGLEFTRRLRGMYALAIYDPTARRLILARDPFGIKPLYYCEGSFGLAFASEPAALVRAGFASAGIEPRVRDELLQLQFTTGRDTIFPGICRVLPGETLVAAEGRIVERRRIEALPGGAPVAQPMPQALAELDAILRDSVAIHRRSDVPYGMFLSGGVDSASVLALMAAEEAEPVTAFTIGFPGTAAADERPLARQVAAALGARHIEIAFEAEDFWGLLPKVAAALDDPVADYAVLPTAKLAAAAREHGLKVVLSGEGGDELFAGYGRHRSVMRPWWAGGKQPRARGNFDGLGLLRHEAAGWRDGILASEVQAASGGRTALQATQASDCADWLPNDLLLKLDRCLMMHGVEGRTPFLDPAVAGFAFPLPDGLKVRDGLGKWLLRRWLAERVPAAEALARKKGFTVPVSAWIAARGPELGPLLAAQPSLQALCLPGTIETLFQSLGQSSGAKHRGFAAWTLLFYALWHRIHIEGLAPEGDAFDLLRAA